MHLVAAAGLGVGAEVGGESGWPDSVKSKECISISTYLCGTREPN